MRPQLTSMLNSAADAWTAWMWPMAWHVALLALVVAVLTWLLRGRSARLRYALWLLIPIRLVLPPTLALATGWGWWLMPPAHAPVAILADPVAPIEPIASHLGPEVQWLPSQPIESQAFVRPEPLAAEDAESRESISPAIEPPQPIASAPISLCAWLFCGWLLGVAILALRLLYGCLCAAKMVRRAQGFPRANGVGITELLESCRRRTGVTRAVRLCQLADAGVPMLIGCVRPTIILPTGLDKQLTSQELEAVLVHELQHVARHDAIVHLGQSLLGVVYFFHPLVWFSNRRLNVLREDACDEATVAVLEGQRRDYGAGIVKVATLMSGPGPSMSLGIVESGSQVKRRLGRILDPRLPVGRRLSWSAFALLLLLAAVVLPVAARPAPSTDPGTTDVTADNRPESEPTKAAPVDDDLIIIPGRVLDAAGNPVAGATVRLVGWYWDREIDHQPIRETQSDNDGRFEVGYRKSQFKGDVQGPDQWKRAIVSAFKPGFGPAWVWCNNLSQGQQAELRLPLDDLPITGRLVDLEGRPLSGVKVKCDTVHAAKGEDLSAWLEAVKHGESRETAAKHIEAPVPVQGTSLAAETVSDADGRFRLAGIGRERMVELVFTGPTVARTSATVVTRPMPPLAVSKTNLPGSTEKTSVLGADFELPLPPTRVVEGVVRDAKTGQPLAGAGVQSWKFAGTNLAANRVLRTATDEKGHFRLVGMPKGSGNEIIVVPSDEQPYLMRLVEIVDVPGIEPVKVEVELHCGIWITGRVTDAGTGAPVSAARLAYFPFLSNEYARALPEFEGDRVRPNFQQRYQTAANGSYRLVGLPGRAIVGVSDHGGSYIRGQGASEIQGIDSNGNFPTFRHTGPADTRLWTALKEINPAADSEAIELDFALNPGGRIKMTTLDLTGQPLSGVAVVALTASGELPLVEGAHFIATGFGPDEERSFVFYHKKLAIGKVVRVRAADGSREIAVQLEPCAKIIGRLVDSNQIPLPGVEIRFDVRSGDRPGEEKVATDADGRFQQSLPAANYSIVAQQNPLGFRRVAKNLAVSPGETIDLGTIDVSGDVRPEPVRTKAADGADARAANDGSNPDAAKAAPVDDDLITIPGRVLDAAGKPVDGATVRLLRRQLDSDPACKPLAETSSDKLGHFEISYRKSQSDSKRPEEWNKVGLAAFMPGYGPDYVWRGKEVLPSQAAELRLAADDVPITGRLLDLEGRPLAGVSVTCDRIRMPVGDDLSAWIEAVKQGETSLQDRQRFRGWFLPEGAVFAPQRTDADGRFRLTGIGRERAVDLIFEGPMIARTQVTVVTRPMAPLAQIKETVWTAPEKFSLLSKNQEKIPVLGAGFEIALPPTRVVEGFVRDAKTGEALAGVGVQSWRFYGTPFAGQRDIRVVSDAQGHFRLVGMPKGPGNRIVAIPGDEQPYLMRVVEVPDEPGLEPAKVVCELHRGIWITGRATHQVTGEPVPMAQIFYLPYKSNEHARALPEFHPSDVGNIDDVYAFYPDRYRTTADGTYRLVGLPGPAIVGLLDETSSFCVGQGASAIRGETEKQGDFSTFLSPRRPSKNWPTAMKEISPDDAAASVELNFALDPGRQIEVSMVDPAGQPLSGVKPPSNVQPPSVTSSFVVAQLGPDEERTILLHHRERALGKVLRLRGDGQQTKVTAKLEPCATVKGRLVDKNQAPIPNAQIRFDVVPSNGRFDHLPVTTTNADGQFENTTVLPGTKYTIAAKGYPTSVKELSIEPGETIDLGTVDITSDERPEPVRTKPDGVSPSGTASATLAAKPAQAEPPSLPQQTVVTGKIVLPDGKPAAAAHVAVIATRIQPGRGGDLSPRGETLAEGTTDAGGNYRLSFAGVSSKTHRDAALIARQDGLAIAWKQFNLDARSAEESLSLAAEEPIRGRLVDIEGKPAAGVPLFIRALSKETAVDGPDQKAVSFDGRGEKVPAAWLAPVTSDAEGRFQLSGIPAEKGVFFSTRVTERFAPQDISLNTGRPEQRGERDMTYRSLVKNVALGEEAVLPLAPAQWFEGRVTYEDTGQPAPHARLTIWASQQEVGGSMYSLAGQADAQGHYRICPHPGVRFGINAYPPDGAPYLARHTRSSRGILWNAGDRVKQVDVTLPRGVLVRGTVVESGTGTPVAGAAIQYVPEESNNPHVKDDILTGWQGIQLSDAQGKFEIAVLPGPGRLLVNGPNGKYVLRQVSAEELRRGKTGGQRNYAHAIERIEPAPGADPIELPVTLQPGATIAGRLVDENGRPVDNALVISRLRISPLNLFWRGMTPPTLGGNFELSGLDSTEEYIVYFLDPQQRLGATQVFRADTKQTTVVLKPCGQASARFVGSDGTPRVDYDPIFHIVVTPGANQYDFEAARRGELAADADGVGNVDRTNYWPGPKTDAQGRITLPALIPGATYRLYQLKGGKLLTLKEFSVQSGEQLELGEFSVDP